MNTAPTHAPTAPDPCDRPWIDDELATADLGDERLDHRMAKLLGRLAGHPSASIPAACHGWAETQAAYRFFDHQAVTAAAVLQPHRDATLRRIAQHPVVLLPQDTTELDFTAKKDKSQGLGPLSDEHRVGLLTHPTIALTPQRLCLGVVHVQTWARPDLEQGDRRKQKAIEDKESIYWLDGYRRACAVAEQVPGTLVVSIADREGDIYECFAAALAEEGRRKASWVIRARHDRCVRADDEVGRLRDLAGRSPVLGTLVVDVPRSPKRKARSARLTAQAVTVQPRPPRRPGGVKLPAVTFQAVLVREAGPPEGEEPIEWLLLTDLPASTFAAACRVVEYYCCRWQIEVFFRVYKSGCKVEERQLETTGRLEPCLALYLIVAWRVLYVTWLGRAYPEVPCDLFFTEAEWKSVWCVVKKAPVPERAPSLGEFVALVAGLGGHLGREHDGPAGAQATWIGLQRLHDFALAWLTFGPGRPATCV
jgi:hypothetical protein